MSSELHNGFGNYNENADTATNQALEFIDTVAFELQLNHDASDIEQTILQAQEDYEMWLESDATRIVDYSTSLIKKALGIFFYGDVQSFNNSYSTPEKWLMHRRHFATIQPDTTTCNNYGVTIDTKTRTIEENRRKITVVVLSQTPVFVRGNAVYDTIGIADISSGIQTNNPNDPLNQAFLDYGYRRASVRNSKYKKTYKIVSPHKIHLVHFRTPEQIGSEVIVPEKNEINEVYDPKQKIFTFDPVIHAKYNNPTPVADMDILYKLYPEQLKNHPDFFSNLVVFLSSCAYFREHNLDKLEEISMILEKYK